MTSRTITADKASYAGTIAGIQFASGTATVDDTTASGAAVVAFAKRQGWAVTGTAANPPTVDEGLPVPSWTIAQLKAYLDGQGVKYPSSASKPQLLDAVQTAYETRAQGGSAALPAAGHTQGTFPVLDAPNVRGDDDTEAAKWSPPVIYSPNGDGAAYGSTPTVTTQPANVSGAVGAQKTITVDGAGIPEPSVQWQKAESTAPTVFADVTGATSKTLNLTLATGDNGDLYRAVLTNPGGSVTSNAATVTVTA